MRGPLQAALAACLALTDAACHHGQDVISRQTVEFPIARTIQFGYVGYWHIRMRSDGWVTEAPEDCATCHAQARQRLRALTPSTFRALVAAARGLGFFSMPAGIGGTCGQESSYTYITIGRSGVSDPQPGYGGVRSRRFGDLLGLLILASHVRFCGYVGPQTWNQFPCGDG